jgi:two-component system sensor kinase FixL
MMAMPADQRHLTISSEITRADAEISVRDTGPGLPADLLGKLFTPYLTTKDHGLGIGLSIARNIVQAHGGGIAVRNNLEGGATFTVTLPVSETHEIRREAPVVAGNLSESTGT